MKKIRKLADIDTIIFDFDGTLHRGELLSLPIFKECLTQFVEQYNIFKNIPSDNEILLEFGNQAQEIYPSLLHTNNIAIINAFAECVEKKEIEALNSGKGELYKNVKSVLSILKNKGYRLALCTNATSDYFNAIVKRFQLNDFFDILFAAGLFEGKDKNWMVKTIINRLNSKNFVVVGDRYHDIKSAKVNGGIAIGCSYGFGNDEVKEADLIIDSLNELLEIL